MQLPEPPGPSAEDVFRDPIEWVKASQDFDRPDNPPASIADEATWERAKQAVEPYWDRYSEPYAVVMHVYKNMGGAFK